MKSLIEGHLVQFTARRHTHAYCVGRLGLSLAITSRIVLDRVSVSPEKAKLTVAKQDEGNAQL